MTLLTETYYSHFPGQEASLGNGCETSIDRLEWQRFSKNCRPNLYQIGLADSLVLVDNIKFPNFKEEINV